MWVALLSKAPKGNGIGATGSKTHPRILEPLFFSAQYASKNPGLVLRPLCPYTVALRVVAYMLGYATAPCDVRFGFAAGCHASAGRIGAASTIIYYTTVYYDYSMI